VRSRGHVSPRVDPPPLCFCRRSSSFNSSREFRGVCSGRRCSRGPTSPEEEDESAFPQADSLEGHRWHKRRREESGSTLSDGELSSETEYSVSDQGGHDNRCPKRRITDVGASKWTLKEWRMLLTTGDASDSKESSNDDGKAQIRAKPSVPKAKWLATDAQRSIARSLRFLQNRKKEALFRALTLPSSIDWLEADVAKGRALADAESRANMAGTYWFSVLSCLETSRAHAMKLDSICKDLPTLSGNIKEDTTAMKAWRDEIRAKSKEWLGHIQIRSDMGSKLAAALFQKETQFMRNEVAKAPRLAPAKSVLLCSAHGDTPLQ
jgi:hypothetical protein